MPYTWFSFSTVTAEELRGASPAAFAEAAQAVIDELNAVKETDRQLLNVFFDTGKEVGYALYRDLGGSVEHKKAARRLGAIDVRKMLDPEQASDVW